MNPSVYKHVVALTGTIGSGKSSVGKFLTELGAKVISADDLAHQASAPGSIGLDEITREFGSDLLLPDGQLNRKQLGKLVFKSPEKRKKLEKILHPKIAKLAEAKFEQALKDQFPLVVYECPLFFEARVDQRGFKKVVLITADRETCLKRIQTRDGLSNTQAENRLDSQLPLEEKLKGADLVLENTGTLEELEKLVKELYDNLQRPAAG